MAASYFFVLILPLGIFVFLMSSLAFYYARQEERARKRWMELTRAHNEMEPNQEDVMNLELKGLEKLLQNKSIDQTTYERLKKALEDYYKVNIGVDRPEEDAAFNFT